MNNDELKIKAADLFFSRENLKAQLQQIENEISIIAKEIAKNMDNEKSEKKLIQE